VTRRNLGRKTLLTLLSLGPVVVVLDRLDAAGS
jgi:hypothetical protein